MGAALPLDSSYQAKPAYDAVRDALKVAPAVILAAGLTNAASYSGGAVSPGEIFVLFGASYGPASLQAGPNPDIQLLFDGISAPLIYSRVGQVSAVVPFAVSGSTSVQYLGVPSNMLSIPVQAVTPGVFTLDATGQGSPAVLDLSFRPIAKDNPARRGDMLQLFATGGGLTTPPSVEGQPGILNSLVRKVSVLVAGIECTVFYAGSAPGLIAGAVQVNFQLDQSIPRSTPPAGY
jgi:uncharacterized protein (TIGR03437 family)